MAHAPPSSPTNSSSSSKKLDYYYFVVGLALVAIVLLITNAVAVGCCSWLRQFLSARGVLAQRRSDEFRRWIPAYKYRKKEHGGGGEAPQDCSVCLSAFDEGEEVRRLPLCGHSFHAACIDRWLCSNTSCPVCRGSVFPSPSHSMEVDSQADLILREGSGGGGGGGGDGIV